LIIYLVTPAQAGVQEKINNINLILDTGLRRYDEEEMKFHTRNENFFCKANENKGVSRRPTVVSRTRKPAV
jgi:hypothetical protein